MQFRFLNFLLGLLGGTCLVWGSNFPQPFRTIMIFTGGFAVGFATQ